MSDNNQLSFNEAYCHSCGKPIKKEAEICPFCGVKQREKKVDEIYCRSCGKIIKKEAEICTFCGVRQKYNNYSDRSWLTLLLLFLFLGGLGVHRFYAGKVISGILFVLTLYGLGIWAIIDFIYILTKNFKDANGRYIRN
ncbi:TM2 domain-containing protein [Brachyspira intermedia]|uniref:TM2 domain-containing protein n=1 Tax=Brachyspira intermedia TaxID=84377 RepID=UPI003007BE5A